MPGSCSRNAAYATPIRIAVYTDYAYARDDDGVYAERAFALFLGALAGRLERMVIVGRLRPSGGSSRYRLPDRVGFVGLPYYESLARPIAAAAAMARSLRRFWRGLDGVDACWLLGPHPLAIAFAALARLRGRKVILGVRQDLVAYTRSRHPSRPELALAARALDAAYRALGRFVPVVVVGPALAARYRRCPRLLEIAVSLVSEAEVAAGEGIRRSYEGELRILSVGRIDEEKNPLMLAEVLARLEREHGSRWRLVVCGEGPLEGALEERLEQLGLGERAELRGYVHFGEPMRREYERAHALLHASWTEGLPQVLVEAIAARLPIVATDVGGIRAALGRAAILVPPGDARAAAAALSRVAAEEATRAELASAAGEYARRHTLEREVALVADFIAGQA